MITALALAVAAPTGIVVVGPLGPELHPVEIVETVAAQGPPEKPERAEPKCLGPSRAFNYAAHALDVWTTVRAINRGAVEVGPLARPILGKRPSAIELIAFKAVPLIGVRLFDQHLVKHSRNPNNACALNIGFGVPALVAAGLNARYAF